MILAFVYPLWSFLQWFTNLLVTKNNFMREIGEKGVDKQISRRFT